MSRLLADPVADALLRAVTEPCEAEGGMEIRVGNPAAFAAWAAERGQTPQEAFARIVRALTPEGDR